MKVQVLCILLTNINSYYRCIWLAAINKVLYIIISSESGICLSIFASGTVLKVLCSVHCYHPMQENAVASLGHLAMQVMPCLQKLSSSRVFTYIVMFI